MENDVKVAELEQVTQEDSERGASLVEYALLVALIAVVCIVTVRLLGSVISGQFSRVSSQLG